MNKFVIYFIVLCNHALDSAKSFEYVSDKVCSHPHYELEIKLMMTYFQDAFYIVIIDTDIDHEHQLNALKCLKMEKYVRPLILYNSIKSITFLSEPKNSSLTTFSQISAYYVKANHSEAIKFFQKMSRQNPITKVLIQLTDHSEELSQQVLQTAFDNYKMLNVAILFRQNHQRFASLKFYNPFIKNGEYYSINVSRQFDLSEIKNYQLERISNLHKFPLRIYIYESPMSVKKITLGKTSNVKFTYIDGEMANMLSEKMNFTAVYVVSNDEVSHNGFLLENGSFSGGVGFLESDRADLLMNPRLITDLNTTRATFLQPLSTFTYKFVIKRLKRNRILPLSIFNLYDKPSKIIALTLLLSFPIIYMIINKLEKRLIEHNEVNKFYQKRSIFHYCTYIFALINNISMRQTHIAPPCSRIIIFVIIFYALLASSVFQGNIVRNLNAQTKNGRIQDVEDLFNEDYKFVLNHVLHAVLKDQRGNELSNQLRKIAAKATITIGSEEGLKILLREKNYACLLDPLYVQTNYLDRYYDNQTGENLLEVVPEKAFEFYVALMASRDSPLVKQFNKHVLRWIEGGFDYYHIHRAEHDKRLEIFNEKHKKGLTTVNKFKSLSVDDLLSVFMLYGFLISVCILAFLFEVSYYYVSKMNKRN